MIRRSGLCAAETISSPSWNRVNRLSILGHSFLLAYAGHERSKFLWLEATYSIDKRLC